WWRGVARVEPVGRRTNDHPMGRRHAAFACGARVSDRIWLMDWLQRVHLFAKTLQTERGVDLRIRQPGDRGLSRVDDSRRNAQRRDVVGGGGHRGGSSDYYVAGKRFHSGGWSRAPATRALAGMRHGRATLRFDLLAIEDILIGSD